MHTKAEEDEDELKHDGKSNSVFKANSNALQRLKKVGEQLYLLHTQC